MIYIYVGAAGVIGAIFRYVITAWVTFNAVDFPWGTLTCNLAGSWLLSWLTAKLIDSPRLRTAIASGMIGSFTTFSAFSVETVLLLENGRIAAALAYAALSFFGGHLLAKAGQAPFTQKMSKGDIR